MTPEETKAIEEMAKVIETTEQIARDAHCGIPSPRMYAKDLYWKGYRKQSEPISCDHEKGGEWISVDERLPNNYRAVLVACEGLTIGGYAPIAIGSYGGGFWSIADADGTMYLTKYMRCIVTHWMPLPEPPMMKGGAE